MLYPVSVQIPFAALFTASKAGKTGLTVTVSIVRLNTDGTRTVVITAASATAATEDDATNLPGLYSYLLASGSTGTAGVYIANFHTTDTTVDLKDIPAIEIVGAAWVATAAAPSTDILATPANKLATDSGGAVTPVAAQALSQHNGTAQSGGANTITLAAGASAVDQFYRGQVIVLTAGTGAGQSRVITDYNGTTKVATIGRNWATNPTLTTTYTVMALALPKVNDSLEVTAGTVNDKTGYSLSTGGVQAIWDALTSALTTAGSIGKRLADNIDATISSRNAVAPDNTSVATILTRTDVATSTRSSHSVSDIWAALLTAITTTGSIGKLIKDYLDAAVSSRNAVAPDNTGIAAILARTDVATSTRASAADYTTARAGKLDHLDVDVSTRNAVAPLDAAGTATAAQTGLTAQGYTPTRAGYLDTLSGLVAAIWAYVGGRTLTQTVGDATAANQIIINNNVLSRLATTSYTPPLDSTATAAAVQTGLTAQGYTTVRAGLLDLLSRVDVAVSTRLAGTAYTAPLDDAGTQEAVIDALDTQGLTAVRAALLDLLSHLDADVSSRLAATDYTVPPTPEAIDAVVWGDTTTYPTGSKGFALDAAGGAANPFGSYPGDYAPGTIGALFLLLTGNPIMVQNPVSADGWLRLRLGNSYKVTPNGNALVWALPPTCPDMRSGTGNSVILRLRNGSKGPRVFSKAAIVTGSPGMQTATVELEITDLTNNSPALEAGQQYTHALQGVWPGTPDEVRDFYSGPCALEAAV